MKKLCRSRQDTGGRVRSTALGIACWVAKARIR